jgi:hypothetical protein
MEGVVIGFMVTSMSVAVFCLYMLARNNAIYRYRTELLAKMWNASEGEDGFHDDYMERAAAFQQVDYPTMVWRFWVWPLSRFYDDLWFIEKGAMHDKRLEKRAKQEVSSNTKKARPRRVRKDGQKGGKHTTA